MKTITIDLRTSKGFLQAEKLKAKGWVVISHGFNSVTMREKPYNPKR